ncbi:hypothetical protein bcere0028_50810 [Bacillus cereus AH1271]|nr:hypothetical protein bcere0028_50810 [Bacillus cereus AH1271]
MQKRKKLGLTQRVGRYHGVVNKKGEFSPFLFFAVSRGTAKNK